LRESPEWKREAFLEEIEISLSNPLIERVPGVEKKSFS
jgi:hypothetical protein